MAQSGQVIENPITGERIVFCKTSGDTHGELLQLDYSLKPRGFVVVEHIHLHQEERFQILSGTPRFRIDGKEQTASPGQTVIVSRGSPHIVWNDAEEESRMLVEFRPALKTEIMFETVFGLAQDGKLNRRGIPNPLQAAVLFMAYRDETLPASRTLKVAASLVLPILAPIARLLGYRAHCSPP